MTSRGPGRAPGPDSEADPFDRSDPPILALTIWPHRSLSRRGFVRFLAFLAGGLAIPILPLLGTPAGWALLPFMLAMLGGVYLALRRSYADGRLVEELRLWPDLIAVERREPRGAVRRWQANPHWVSVALSKNARIENYLTLTGNGREIELGAFLSPEEREALHADLRRALSRLGRPAPLPS
jgi:uncharacterized membrane protein